MRLSEKGWERGRKRDRMSKEEERGEIKMEEGEARVQQGRNETCQDPESNIHLI